MGEGNINEEIKLIIENTQRILTEINKKEVGEEEFRSSWDEECKGKKSKYERN